MSPARGASAVSSSRATSRGPLRLGELPVEGERQVQVQVTAARVDSCAVVLAGQLDRLADVGDGARQVAAEGGEAAAGGNGPHPFLRCRGQRVRGAPQPAATVRKQSGDQPVAGQPHGELRAEPPPRQVGGGGRPWRLSRRVAGTEREVERGHDVRVLAAQPADGRRLISAADRAQRLVEPPGRGEAVPGTSRPRHAASGCSRQAVPRRTRAARREAGSGPVAASSLRSTDLSTRPISVWITCSRASRPPAHTCSAPAASNFRRTPTAGPERPLRRGAQVVAPLHRGAQRLMPRARAAAVLARASPCPDSSWSASSGSGSARSRTAASSIASGMPSSSRHSRTTSARLARRHGEARHHRGRALREQFRGVAGGRRLAARAPPGIRQRRDGSGTGSGSTGKACSPGVERLAACREQGDTGAARSSASANAAHVSTRCSQLSRMSSSRRSRSLVQDSRPPRRPPSGSPSTAATAAASSARIGAPGRGPRARRRPGNRSAAASRRAG